MDPSPLRHDPAADLAFLGGRAGAGGGFELPVVDGLVSPSGGLYGGAGIAALAAAMELATGRPLRWITCQFAASARTGQTLALRVDEDARGRRVSQAHAVATVEDRVVLRATGALGEVREPVTDAREWVAMPQVTPPERCDLPTYPFPTAGTAIERSDRRVPPDMPAREGRPRGAGFRVALWSRIRGHRSTSPAMLAWLADLVPMGLGIGLGRRVGGSSLDNTLRMVEVVDTDWVLLDVGPSAVRDGYGHGDVRLWSTDGRLLATGAQTAMLRELPG